MEATATEKKIVFVGNTKMYYNIQRKAAPENAPPFIVANVSYHGLIPRPVDESSSKGVELTEKDKSSINNAEKVLVVADTKSQFLEMVRMLAKDFNIASEKFVMVTHAGNQLKSFDTMGEGTSKVKVKELLTRKFIETSADTVQDYILKLYDSKQHEKLKKELSDFRSGKKVEAEKAAKRSSGETSPKQRPLTIADEKVRQCKAQFDDVVAEVAVRPAELKRLALEINQKANVVEKEVAEYQEKLGSGVIERGIAKDLDHVLSETFESAVHWLMQGAEAFCVEISEIKANPGLNAHEKIAQIKTAMGHIETLAGSAERKMAESNERNKKIAKLRSFKISSKIILADVIASLSVEKVAEGQIKEAKTLIQTAREEIADIQHSLTPLQYHEFLATAAEARVKVVELESAVLARQKNEYAVEFEEESRRVAHKQNRVEKLAQLKDQATEINAEAEVNEEVAVNEKDIFDAAKTRALEEIDREVESDFAQITKAIHILENKEELDKPRIKTAADILKSNRITFQPVTEAIGHLNTANDTEKSETIIQTVQNAVAILKGIQRDTLVKTTEAPKRNFADMQASVDQKVEVIRAQKTAAAKDLNDIENLHIKEAAKIDERVAFLSQPDIDRQLDQNAITRNVVAEADLQNAEVICIHFDASSPVFSQFWNEEQVRKIKAAENVKILFLSQASLQIPQGLRDFEELADPAVEVKRKIAAVQADGFHIAEPVFVENVEDFKAKAKDPRVEGSKFAPAPAMEPVALAAPQEKKNPHRGSLHDFKHARFERKAYLTNYFNAHGQGKSQAIDLDWMQLQLLSMERNCETAQHILNLVGDQIEQLHSRVDETKYRLVLELLQLLDKEERRLKPKVITFFASARYSEKYIAQREAKRKLILATAEQVFKKLKVDNHDYAAIRADLKDKPGHVAKAMREIFEKESRQFVI